MALRRRVGQLRRRRVGGAVAVAALVVLAVPLGQASLERLREPAGAVDRPPGPRAEGASLWIGNGLFLWGGGESWNGGRHADGWLFDPVARRWHAIAPAPLAGRSLAAAIWTGEEVLVWGGSAGGSTAFGDGAAYDPATGAWRTLPPVRLSPQASAAAWTGSGVLALDYELRAAFYDPGRNA